MAVYTTEQILQIQHWSDKLFSFRTTRAAGLRFENGQFVMLGLQVADRKIVRAYSIASANYEEHLEFYSINVPGGALTSRLQHVTPGCPILVSSKPTGTLVLRDLRPGKRLFLLATGTGIAPFMSIVKDPLTYETFEQIVMARGVRLRTDLAYGDSVLASLRSSDYLGDAVRGQLLDYPCVSREPFRHVGRVTGALESGRLCNDLNIAPLDPRTDRLMICGNVGMLATTRQFLDTAGFDISPQTGVCGDYVIERAFTDSLERKSAAA
ncbi:MAG TPA: ferredoxin--NADP reductase [Steroidobacteraceae bacterium]|nr:ferredoxin--NADP reductase [Steroidobacteraceae bacterium]